MSCIGRSTRQQTRSKTGSEKGDRVALYLPPCVESVVSMLACAKIGAVHNVVYAGFSVHALAERINDAKAKVLITADGTFRRGQVIDLKQVSDEAVSSCPSIETTIVVKHAGNPVTMSDLSGKEVFFHTLVEGEPAECRVEPWTLKTSFTSYTPRAAQGSQRASCTPQAATWLRPRLRLKTSLISTTMTCGGARRTSGGSRDTATSCTHRCSWGPQRSSTRAPPTTRNLTHSGASSNGTGSRSSTPPRRRFGT